MLKFIEEKVPVGLEEHYEEIDTGKFQLKVDGVVAKELFDSEKTKVKQFRDNNVSLTKQVEKYKSISDVLGGDNFDPTKIDEKINTIAESRALSKVEEMKKAHDTEKTELTERLQKADGLLYNLTLTNEVTKAATKHGVLSSALEDVSYRAKDAFEVKDGAVKFKQDKLDSSGKAYTIDSWMSELAKRAEHLFERSKGTNVKNANSFVLTPNTENVTGLDMISAGLTKKSAAKTVHS